MTELSIAPMPEGLGHTLTEEEVGRITAHRLGRRQVVGIGLAITGLLLAFAVAPNLTSEERRFNFEKPPDPVGFSFDPQVLVRVIGLFWVVAGISAFLPWRRVATVLQAIAGVLTIPLLLGLGLALSTSTQTNMANLLSVSLVLSTPYVYGSMTGLWCERSGIVNIGIEGQMLAAAGVAYMAYALLGDAAGGGWLAVGILVAVVTGALAAALHAVLCIRFQINQIVAGVVINLVALGLTGFLRTEVIVPSGFTKGTSTPTISIPLLSRLPVVGEEFFTGKPIYLAMYVVVFVSWLVLYRTPSGLRIRACGENPHAAETVGVDVVKLRYRAVIIGGLIAGLAGTWFSIEGGQGSAGFEEQMTNSAGFIALAALIVGKWTPSGAFAGALLFGFSRALGARLQFLQVQIGSFEIPSEWFQALPYVVTLVVVAGALGRSIAPAAEGQPFSPSK